jgi:hypothetical protein
MAVAGYNCRLYLTGTATSFTTEATTNTTGHVWQITNANKQIWNPNVVPSFFDNAVAIPEADILSIDYLFGAVTFTGAKTGPITVTGSYLPYHVISETHEFNFSLSRDVIDVSVLGVDSRQRIVTILDGTGDFTVYDAPDTDYDPGAGTRKLKTLFDAGTQFVLVFRVTGDATNTYRFWAIITNLETAASVDGLIETTVSWQVSPVADEDNRPAHFSYRDL